MLSITPSETFVSEGVFVNIDIIAGVEPEIIHQPLRLASHAE